MNLFTILSQIKISHIRTLCGWRIFLKSDSQDLTIKGPFYSLHKEFIGKWFTIRPSMPLMYTELKDDSYLSGFHVFTDKKQVENVVNAIDPEHKSIIIKKVYFDIPVAYGIIRFLPHEQYGNIQWKKGTAIYAMAVVAQKQYICGAFPPFMFIVRQTIRTVVSAFIRLVKNIRIGRGNGHF